MQKREFEKPILLLLNELKTKKNVPWTKVGRGLVPRGAITDIVQGKTDASVSLMELLIQRLGASLDNFELIVSYEDYSEILLREEIESDIFHGRKTEAEEKLNTLDISKKYVLLYFYRLKALEEFLINKDNVQCEKMLEKAVQISLDGESENELMSLLLSETEIENFIALGKIRYLNGAEYESVLEKAFGYYDYIEKHFEEEEERAKLIAKCTWLIADILNNQKFYAEAAHRCLIAIDLLGKWNQFYFMEPLLEEMAKAYTGIGVLDSNNVWKQAFETFSECKKTIGTEEIPNDIIILNFSLKELILDREVIACMRKNRKLTQEQLADGVFSSAKPISDFERGKSSLTRSNLQKVLKKLDNDKNIWNSYYSYSSYEMQKKKVNLNRLMFKMNFEECEQILIQLEKQMGKEKFTEDRDLSMLRDIVNVEMKKGNASQLLEREREYLGDFLNVNDTTCNRIPFFSDMFIMNNYFKHALHSDDKEKLLKYITGMMSTIEEGMGREKHRYRTYGTLFNKLLTLSESKEDAVKAFQMDISHGKACGFLTEIQYIGSYFEECGDRDKAVLWAKTMLYYSYLYFFEETYKVYHTYLRDEYGVNLPFFERHPHRNPQEQV